jgi:hypothetical protein
LLVRGDRQQQHLSGTDQLWIIQLVEINHRPEVYLLAGGDVAQRLAWVDDVLARRHWHLEHRANGDLVRIIQVAGLNDRVAAHVELAGDLTQRLAWLHRVRDKHTAPRRTA